jgi:tRNA(Ile)-lysidine synthase
LLPASPKRKRRARPADFGWPVGPAGLGKGVGRWGRPAYDGSTVTWDSFLNQIQGWLEQRDLLKPEAHWVIGLSGGADSTVLVHALRDVSERAELGWKLFPAHFHHGLRGNEADEDAQFVSDLADELNLPFFSEKADIRAAVEEEGGSTEEVARRHRYAFLERVALKTGSEWIAVAHHADDNAETVLHRICRGTGLRGLIGIRDLRPVQPDSHVQVVRPLLHQRRETIEEMCKQQNIRIRTDSTNLSDEFTRGRIRHRVMPVLREALNPQVADALLRLGEHARWLGNYLEDAAMRVFESLVISQRPQQIVLNAKALLGKQRIIQAEVIRRTVALVGGEQDLSFTNVNAILKLAEDPGSGKEVHVPGPVLVRKQYDRLDFRPLVDNEPPPDLGTVFVICPGKTTLGVLGCELEAELHDVGPELVDDLRVKNDPYEEWLDYDKLHLPLLVRGRRDGDRFRPLGSPGAKTVSEFFSNEKLDPDVRARTGILCDQDGPVWVMPLRIDERVKISAQTRKAVRLVLHARGNAAPLS